MGDSAKCKHCGETGHNLRYIWWEKALGGDFRQRRHRFCVRGQQESCSNNSNVATSSEEEATFICDTLGKLSKELFDEGSCSVFAWQVGDYTII